MKKLAIFFLAFTLGAGITSCKKKGCTDSTATNYNNKAKKDNGSCLYKPFINVIGASDTPGKIGYAVVRSLIESKYEGPIYPINPKAAS